MRDIILIFLGAFIWFQVGQSCAANAAEPQYKSNIARYKIAIVDTGYDVNAPGPKLKLCKSGHFDYKTNTATIGNTLAHGTRVASIIAERLVNVDYCAVILQVGNGDTKDFPISNMVKALARAASLQVDAVNYSLDGSTTSVAEREAIKLLVKHGVGVFVPAGNTKKDLDLECDVFPACFDIPGMNVVGALDPLYMETAEYSNRGKKVTAWYSGSWEMNGERDRGTSYASPRALSDYVLSLVNDAKPTNIKLPSEKLPTLTTNTRISTTTLEN